MCDKQADGPSEYRFPILKAADLTSYHRDSDGRPEFNVKAHNWSAIERVDFASLRDECGISPDWLAPASNGALLPFGLEWIKASSGSWLEDQAEQWAREQAWDDGQEYAREVFGDRDLKVYSAGRSGGWAYLSAGSTVADLKEAEQAIAAGAADEDIPYMTRAEFEQELRALSDFADYCAGYLRDSFPRMVAWQWAQNCFLPRREEYLERKEREEFEALGRAAAGMRAEVEALAERVEWQADRERRAEVAGSLRDIARRLASAPENVGPDPAARHASLLELARRIASGYYTASKSARAFAVDALKENS